MNRVFSNFLATSTIIASMLLSADAFATKYEYDLVLPPPADCTRSNSQGEFGIAGYLNSLHSKFDSVTNIFTWTANFSPCQGVLPDGYWLVVNNGPNPKGHSGELGIIYFDASDLTDPIVTAYAYNGKNNFDSYMDGLKRVAGNQAPDRILSSITNSSWILSKFVKDEVDGSRTFHLKINATTIINHTPFYPVPRDPWYGVGIDDFIGYWFHPTTGTIAEYCTGEDADPVCQNIVPGQSSRGFLKYFNKERSGWYDKAEQETNAVPVCRTKIAGIRPPVESQPDYDSDNTVERALRAIDRTIREEQEEELQRCVDVHLGDSIQVVFTGTDADDESLGVKFSGVPQGAILTDSDGNPVSSGGEMRDPARIYMNWAPGLDDLGTEHSIRFLYIDDDRAPARCTVDLCVPQNKVPFCKIRSITNNDQCGGVETYVDMDGSASFDPEGNPLTFEWVTTCTNSNGQTETLITRPELGGARLVLTQPGEGNDVNCEVTLAVSDGFFRSECSLPIEVQGCSLDCEGTPNGNAMIDQCGVCNGTNACLDCAGTPFGSEVLDACGVCGGTNACLDCAGTPFGTEVLDTCGVCGGDNTSCITCEQSDITVSQFNMDGDSLALRLKVYKATKLLMKADKSPAAKKFIKKTRNRADQLYMENWVLTWSIPSIQTFCTDNVICATVDNSETVNSFQQNAEELRDLAIQSVKKLRVALGKPKARKKLMKQIKAEYFQTVGISSAVPATSSICSF